MFDIIEQQGSLLHWQRSWNDSGEKLPINSSGAYYHGANILLLLHKQLTKGYAANQWLTFNQVNKLGGNVQKGAKSEEVFFWKIVSIEDKKTNEVNNVPIFKTYHVFNLEQTTLEKSTTEAVKFESEKIDELIKKLGVSVSHFGGRAYYTKNSNTIVLPNPNKFNEKENYYATLLHELVHWTASNDCAPRKCYDNYHTDIKTRAEEELIAEIGSVFLMAHYGVRGELENHASYVQSWKQELSEKQVVTAINKAAKAFEWIINQAQNL